MMTDHYTGKGLKNSPGLVRGCVLIGGRSSRMGVAKHLLQHPAYNEVCWIEHIVQVLHAMVDEVVVAGQGELPVHLSGLIRVADDPQLRGPLAGILPVLRSQPGVSWIITACDLPDISTAAVHWLLTQRGPGIQGIMPDLTGQGRVEPLLAYYDHSLLAACEELARSGQGRLYRLAEVPGVISPVPPSALIPCWRNVNTPGDLAFGQVSPSSASVFQEKGR